MRLLNLHILDTNDVEGRRGISRGLSVDVRTSDTLLYPFSESHYINAPNRVQNKDAVRFLGHYPLLVLLVSEVLFFHGISVASLRLILISED